jgi:hypothetical protein
MNQDSRQDLSKQTGETSGTTEVVSIVHQADREETESEAQEMLAVLDAPYMDATGGQEYDYLESGTIPPREKTTGQKLITPWGMSSLFLFLLGNALLSWVQWSNPQPSPAQVSESLLPSLEVPVSNPTFNLRGQLSLESLSVVDMPKSPAPVSNSPPTAITNSASSPAPSAYANQAATSLTNALLPPSLQPQIVQTVPLPVAQTPPPAQSLPIVTVNQPLPLPPSVRPVTPARENSPADTQTGAQLNRERILEEIRLSELQKSRLGFNHKTRARLQSAQSQQDPSPLIDQLERVQQQRINR